MKSLRLGGFVVLLVAAIGIVSLFVPASRVSRTVAPVDFPEFAVGDTRRVQFSATAGIDPAGPYDNDQERARRRLDQLRDWCLLTVIAASNLPAKDISQATYDVPTLREESLRRVTPFEYGESRSRVIGDGDIVALVGKGSPEQRRDILGQIADEQRMNLGEIPARFHVFEYQLEPASGYAELRRLPIIPGADLFTAAYGYREREISGRRELETFLAEIDDLTLAHRAGARVVLGGRTLSSGYARIGLEEVATIWRGQRGLPEYQGVGFSLDPRLDAAVARRVFTPGFAEPLGRYFGVDQPLIDRARAILDRPAPKNAQERADQAFEFINALVAACVASADATLCLKTIDSAAFDSSYQVARYEGNNLAGTEVGMVLFYTDLLMKVWSFDFEGSAPRAVPGFPVGSQMRLSPVYRGDVERAPATRMWLEPLDRGYQITDGRDRILFSRTATRVAARAHAFLTGRDEDFEPNVFSRVLIDWWNDHYEEIARYEPQYQRLNEITKWGVVMAWLDVERQLPALAFLSDSAAEPIQVARNHRLPEWASRHADLRFTQWNKIQFDRPEQARAEYESLELLRSPDIPYFTGPIVFQGGVSLSSRATIAERAAISGRLNTLEATARRAGVDTRLTNLGAGRLRTLDATTYEFKNYSQQAVSTLAKAKPSARLSDAFGELENVGFDRTVRRTTDGLLLRTQAESSASSRLSGELGELRIGRAGRDYSLHWESRDLDLGHSLARRLSTAANPEAVLAAQPNVELSIALEGNQGYFVRVRGSDAWIKLSPARADSRSIAAGYQARVAGVGGDARTIDVAWLDDAAVRAQIEPNGYLQLSHSDTASGGVRLTCCARAPPSGATQTSIRAAGQEFRGAVDVAGTRYVRVAELPERVRADLATLTGAPPRLTGRELQLARSLERGEYRQAARELAENRLEFQARLHRLIEHEIEVQQTMNDVQALAHVDAAIRTVGPTPDLSVTKALIHLRRGDSEVASAALNAARGTPATDVERLIAETPRIGPRTAIETANQAEVVRWLRWQQLPSKSGDITAVGRGGRLTLDLRMNGLPRGRVLQASDVAADLADRNAIVYLHDTPALNNLDVLTSPGRRSLQQLVIDRRITIRELELNDVARFRPAVITDVTATARSGSYTLANANTSAARFSANAASSRPTSSSRDNDCDDGNQGDKCRAQQRRVFVVEAGR